MQDIIQPLSLFSTKAEFLKKALKGKGIEIGVGTGRFAAPLGIESGIEPSKMAIIAKNRGINVINAFAEHLPIKNSVFDFVLMVTTVCFLDNIENAFQEVKRILKPGAQFVWTTPKYRVNFARVFAASWKAILNPRKLKKSKGRGSASSKTK